ncbi:hypothetical protein I312_104756 [Cryptococcus bacillisporus CA1280]
MQPAPASHRKFSDESTSPHASLHNQEEFELEDDFDYLSIATPSRPNTSKRATPNKGKAIETTKWKGKGKARNGIPGGECYLLKLPGDLLHTLMSRLSPRTLLKISETCKLLNEQAENDTVWRHSYVNRFLGEGVGKHGKRREEIVVLAQSCVNVAGRGWKKEALGREVMLDLWTDSKTSIVMHTPPTGLIHSISLYYPPFLPSNSKSLVIGKNRQPTPKDKVVYTSKLGEDGVNALQPTTPKMTHRQKYEAVLAATTRPPPYILSASLFMGGVVRSDPISGKVSKGFWGPGRDANFHIRPHIDPLAEPSAIYLPSRSQSFILWGLQTGSVVFTSVQTRNHATHGGRATSVNVYSDPRKAHEGFIVDIWAPQGQNDTALKWVTAGQDGRVKLWELQSGTITKVGKRQASLVDGNIECVFTSPLAGTGFPNRSELVKRRQAGKPDGIVLARYDLQHDTLAGVTEDGDLRVWFAASSGDGKEVRIDLGSAEVEGEVKVMEMIGYRHQDEVALSVLIHRRRSHVLTRHDISKSGDHHITTFYSSVGAPLSCIHPPLSPNLPISAPKHGNSTPMLARIVTPGETPDPSPPPLDLPSGGVYSSSTHSEPEYGRYVLAGDEAGFVHLWAWNGVDNERKTIRSWEAMEGKITALDMSCGLVAVGSFDGFVKIYDPLPTPPKLLRTFHASHLSPGELLVAGSDQPDARFYTVNKIILENDMVVASIGRKVFAWRAGAGKGKHGGKEGKKGGIGKCEGRGGTRGIVMKALHQAAEEDFAEFAPHAATPCQRLTNPHETLEREAMQEMGLEDGDDALQYALMLSMEEQSHASPPHNDFMNEESSVSGWVEGEDEEEDIDEETAEAIRQVEAFKKAEQKNELARMLEMIKQAETRER